MKVFEFAVESEWKEWVVANDLESATEYVKEVTDIYEEYKDGQGPQVEARELNDSDLDTLKFDPDPEGTGEFDESRAIPFREALKLRSDPAPYLLCSQID